MSSSIPSIKGAKVAQESGVPLMTPASTNVDITKKGEFVSRICFIDPVQGSTLATLALTDLKKTKAAIIVDKASDRVVGVHMVGPDAGEIIQGIAIALRAGATKSTFDTTIGNWDRLDVEGAVTQTGTVIATI